MVRCNIFLSGIVHVHVSKFEIQLIGENNVLKINNLTILSNELSQHFTNITAENINCFYLLSQECKHYDQL